MKNQGNTTLSKEYSKPTVTGPREMKIQELSDEEFKIIVLKMLRELKENTDKKFNDIRKTIQEHISSTKRYKT